MTEEARLRWKCDVLSPSDTFGHTCAKDNHRSQEGVKVRSDADHTAVWIIKRKIRVAAVLSSGVKYAFLLTDNKLKVICSQDFENVIS